VALRLERLALPQPVEQLGLRATRVLPLAPPRRDLFRRTPEPEEGLSGLVARLTARLGEAAVATPALVSDHRPERAWRWRRPGTTAAGAPPLASLPPRPLWLLESPRRLEAGPAGPRHGGGGLRLLEGPERIESGWWDGGDVRRDYYRAVDGRGRRLWIYRDLRGEGRWFLHGLFG
jgi:protein ImuB